jgi:hypothetical protein
MVTLVYSPAERLGVEPPAKPVGSNGLLAGRLNLEVTWSESCPLRDASQHARPDLFTVMERKDEVGPPFTRQCPMGTGLALDGPTNPQKNCQHPASADARPSGHAALNEMLRRSGPASPCSRRSAMTRSASA